MQYWLFILSLWWTLSLNWLQVQFSLFWTMILFGKAAIKICMQFCDIMFGVINVFRTAKCGNAIKLVRYLTDRLSHKACVTEENQFPFLFLEFCWQLTGKKTKYVWFVRSCNHSLDIYKTIHYYYLLYLQTHAFVKCYGILVWDYLNYSKLDHLWLCQREQDANWNRTQFGHHKILLARDNSGNWAVPIVSRAGYSHVQECTCEGPVLYGPSK